MRVLFSNDGFSLDEFFGGSWRHGIWTIVMPQTFSPQQKMLATITTGFETVDVLSRLGTFLEESETCNKLFLGQAYPQPRSTQTERLGQHG